MNALISHFQYDNTSDIQITMNNNIITEIPALTSINEQN